MDLTVRIIKTYHVAVTAQYGDTETTLCEKGGAALAPDAEPDAIAVMLMPEGAAL